MRDKGFTLIELLIVVAIIGIIAAIAIPSLLNALDRARQGTSVSNVLEAGKGVERYRTDHPKIGPPDVATIADLQTIFQTTEINTNPGMTRDGWAYDLVYARSGSGPTTWSYSVTSQGSDGAAGPAVTPDASGQRIVKVYTEDIIWSNGVWYQRPEGAQTSQ